MGEGRESLGRAGRLMRAARTAPPQFAADIRADIAKWDRLIKSLGIRLD